VTLPYPSSALKILRRVWRVKIQFLPNWSIVYSQLSFAISWCIVITIAKKEKKKSVSWESRTKNLWFCSM
jgi:hypothetical protein